MVCDFSGEGSLILLLVDRLSNAPDRSLSALQLAQVSSIERAFTLLSAGAANGLYTIGGIMLTLITPGLPKWVRAAMWVTWIAGIGMTIAALANHAPGMVADDGRIVSAVSRVGRVDGARWPAASSFERSRCETRHRARRAGLIRANDRRTASTVQYHRATASRRAAAELRIDANDQTRFDPLEPASRRPRNRCRRPISRSFDGSC